MSHTLIKVGLALNIAVYGSYGGLGLGGVLLTIFFVVGAAVLIKRNRSELRFNDGHAEEAQYLIPKRSKGLYGDDSPIIQ